MDAWHLLSWVVLTPMGAALLLWTFPSGEGRGARGTALCACLIELALVGCVAWAFQTDQTKPQLVEQMAWIPSLGVSWALGIDGFSLLFVVLNAVLMPIAVLASFDEIRHKSRDFLACLLLLQGALMGGFLARDLFCFYVFWEAMLVPAYFLVGAWGKERAARATMRFFLTTMAGSMLLLVAMAVAASLGRDGQAPSFLLDDVAAQLSQADLGFGENVLFLGFAIAFLVKVPLLFLHAWMPETYSEAPACSLLPISGVMVKLGALALLRFGFLLLPRAATALAPSLLTLALAGCLYAAWLSAGQSRLRRVFAYASMSHMGLCVLAMVAMTPLSLTGCMVQLFNHGLHVAALFLLVGMLERRCHSDHLGELGGIADEAPHLAVCMGIAGLATIGVPGLNGFVGEFLLLAGSFQSEGLGVGVSEGVLAQAAIVALLTLSALFLLRVGYALWALQGAAWQSVSGRVLRAVAAASLCAGTASLVWLPMGEIPGGVAMAYLAPLAKSDAFLTQPLPLAVAAATLSTIVAAVYMLRALERTLFGVPAKHRARVHDLSLRERLCIYPLMAAIVFLGVYPRPLIAVAEPLAQSMAQSFREGAGWPSMPPPAAPAEKHASLQRSR